MVGSRYGFAAGAGIFGALVVLSLFVAGAVFFTRWLDGQTGRAFFQRPGAPLCRPY